MDWATFLQVIVNGVLKSGLYALTSIGLALSIGVIGIVNFAHGEFLMLGAYLGYWLFTLAGIDPLVSLLLGGLLLFAVGALLYRASIRRVLTAPELNQMLLTFGISIFLQNLALILWQGQTRVINPFYRDITIRLGPVSLGVGRFLTFVIAVLLIYLLFRILAGTRFGRAMRAVSQNRTGASLVAIDVERVYLLAFGLSAGLAGMAGVMLSIVLYADPMVGVGFVLKSFAIIVLAGLGNMHGVVWASLILGLAESFVGTYVPQGSGWADGTFFIIILLVLIFRPKGFARA